MENSIGKPAKWYGKPAIAALEMTVEPLMHVEAPLNWMRSRNGNGDLGAEKTPCALGKIRNRKAKAKDHNPSCGKCARPHVIASSL